MPRTRLRQPGAFPDRLYIFINALISMGVSGRWRTLLLITAVTVIPPGIKSQNPAPGSAQAAANSDAAFISANIVYHQQAMSVAQTGLSRASDARVRDWAEQTLADHTQMLYTVEQLQSAGSGASGRRDNQSTDEAAKAADLNRRLSLMSGGDFDTLWVSGLLTLQQEKYDQFVSARETVTNPQLKMAVNEALPILRKQVSQLKILHKYLLKKLMQQKKEAARPKP